MHSYEDRIRAVELYYRYGKKASVVVMELGYPSTKQLGRWVRIYEEKGDLPRELKPRERYSRTQKIAAVEHYLTHGGCLSYTRRAIGYPSNEILKRWIEEFYPNARPLVIRSGTNKCFSPEERSQAVRELCNRRGTARKVAQSIGVSVPVLYKWKKDLIRALLNKSDFGQVSPVVGCVFRQYARFQAYLLSSFCSALVPGP